MVDQVTTAYSQRSAEYTELFGSMRHVHPSDLALVTTWAASVDGPVIDAGCGPGQWTAFLTERGLSARGVDRVPEFVARARRSYPGVPFALGSLDALDAATGSSGGVLAWYSLIHREPSTIQDALQEFHRVLKPGGALLIGFFEGAALEPFDHAVVTAHRWPVDRLAAELELAGFGVHEKHVRVTAGERPQAAIWARA
ncbi:class I SAM-dependent methyltransferase [Herbiconiux flava]|uniref:SAM-dependent methyltransferase n=1 Tax=Herbiconiux flava TaxID=881268 RepID=A0A852ST94_9MICO|nr:class I SAM-dependent methyltransferase [Herbiconiux flava]NYD72186.1 SAM-dependent methyltransferase [Herbiconiux flava]GLK17850.1 methyltransferase [Herbiconiux flava]